MRVRWEAARGLRWGAWEAERVDEVQASELTLTARWIWRQFTDSPSWPPYPIAWRM